MGHRFTVDRAVYDNEASPLILIKLVIAHKSRLLT